MVQSPYPGWKFSAPEAIAAQSLHGALVLGPRVAAGDGLTDSALAGIEVTLFRDGREVARGSGRLVLDSPLHALSHLVREMSRRGESIAPGAIVTTGTLTDAQPLAPGQRWHTEVRAPGLSGLSGLSLATLA